MNIKRSLFLIVVGGLLLRAILAFSFEGTGDTGTWRLGGRTGLEQEQLGMGNGTVYDGDCPSLCSNWPPLTFHYMVMMRWASLNLNPLDLRYGYYKLFPFLADTATIALVYLYAKKRKLADPLLLAGIYAFHPIALYVSGYHGQRDTIWVFFTLLSLYLLELKNSATAAVMYAIGTSIKIPSLLLFPYFLLRQKRWEGRVIFSGLFIFLFVLLNSPELLIYFNAVVRQVFLYQGWIGWWGISGLVTKIDIWLPFLHLSAPFALLHRVLLYISILAANIYFARRSKDTVLGALGVIATVAVMAPAFASQYLIWVLPFLLLMPARYNRFKLWYSILGTYMAMVFYGVIPFFPLWNKLLLDWPTKYLFYQMPQFVYPMDISWPVWALLALLLYTLVYDVKNQKKTRTTE